ncbi:hypothetical protein JCM11641_007243 [Rhodosporidiobolus odoratus]
MSSTTARTYQSAVDALNSLQSNAATIEAIRKSGGKGGDVQLREQVEYMQKMGYSPEDLNHINVLHITGTKGKGSTSAFVSSLLTTLAPSAKIGLYTSPHMVAVRERIRINGEPIAEEMFAKYFWDVWDKLEADPTTADADTPEKPAYFRYLTIMAMHVFLQEKVDATILEVGVGGTFDSTNIVPSPITTGVTALGIDHIWVLGKTLPEIAHQKGGIYKAGTPALAVAQPEGLDVLESRSKELQASSFTVIPELAQLNNVKLGLAGAHQRQNASLAIALVQSFLSSTRCPPVFSEVSLPSPLTPAASADALPTLPSSLTAPNPLPRSYTIALENARWPGRCQIEQDKVSERVQWYLDGAHTVESLKCCGEWFDEAALRRRGDAVDKADFLPSSSSSAASRILIFNCTSGRSGLSLLGTLLAALSSTSSAQPSQPFAHVIFCTNTTYSSGASKGDLTSNAVDPSDLAALATQREIADAWAELTTALTPQATVHVLASIEEAVAVVRKAGEKEDVQALVTGSLHLVGGVMAVAELPL